MREREAANEAVNQNDVLRLRELLEEDGEMMYLT